MSNVFLHLPDMERYMPEIDPARLAEVLRFDAGNPLLFNTGLFLLLFTTFIGIYALLSRFKYVKMIFVILHIAGSMRLRLCSGHLARIGEERMDQKNVCAYQFVGQSWHARLFQVFQSARPDSGRLRRQGV